MIDPSTNIMYLVASTLEGGTMVYRLHAVNITNGTEPYPTCDLRQLRRGDVHPGPPEPASVADAFGRTRLCSGSPPSKRRPTMSSGYSGWVMAYNKQTLVQSGIFALVTTGSTRGGGVWQSGRPPVVDGSGFVYVFTGNGYKGAKRMATTASDNFSETALKLDPDDGLALVDWFTPDNWSAMDLSR